MVKQTPPIGGKLADAKLADMFVGTSISHVWRALADEHEAKGEDVPVTPDMARLVADVFDQYLAMREVIILAARHDSSDWPEHCRAIVKAARAIPLDQPTSKQGD